MAGSKKIISFAVKLLIGVISFWIIYKRLSEIPQLKEQCLFWLSSPKMYVVFLLVLLLMPVNWGIEIYKWQSITRQTEPVSYTTAFQSVFSGICVGNIAPGRAMEFLAKIVFFKPENRPVITVLHFINGMFQMLITVTAGIICIAFKLNKTQTSSVFAYAVIGAGILLILFFCWAIFNVSYIQQKLKFIKWFQKIDHTDKIRFPKKLIIKLISLSVLRYFTFTMQFYLVFNALLPQNNFIETFTGIAAYFMLTSLIPMISVIEPAIRAAIALFVFSNGTDNTVTVVITSTIIWFINVVIPSAIGYIVILRKKIDFRSARAH